jgi:hypothetical protein
VEDARKLFTLKRLLIGTWKKSKKGRRNGVPQTTSFSAKMIDMRQLSILVVVTIRLFVCYAATSTGKLLINVTICSAIDIALSELFTSFAPIPFIRLSIQFTTQTSFLCFSLHYGFVVVARLFAPEFFVRFLFRCV